MGDEFAAVGGMLKTGFFDPDMDVKDIRARIHRFRDRFEEHAFLRELINPHPTAYQALRDIDRVLDEHGFHVTHVVEDAVVRRPQLHLKAQFFASREAWRSLLGEPIMRDVLNTYCVERARQLQAERVKPTHLQTTLNGVARDSFAEKIESLPPEIGDRIIWYLSVGSQNQDYRGMFLDGEVTFVTAGWEVVWGLMDFVWILGMCDWVTDVEGIERHLSTYSEFQRYIGRMATILM
jgi:hypothetical protein